MVRLHVTLVTRCRHVLAKQYFCLFRVHIECLRRWQRSVLVTQPTHPAFYDEDDRHEVCNVCRQGFNLAPPTRGELMAGFTGPEIAALLDVGCLIVCEARTSAQMVVMMRRFVHLAVVSSLRHWVQGTYLITGVHSEAASDGEDCITAVSLTRRVDFNDLPLPLRQDTARMISRDATSDDDNDDDDDSDDAGDSDNDDDDTDDSHSNSDSPNGSASASPHHSTSHSSEGTQPIGDTANNNTNTTTTTQTTTTPPPPTTTASTATFTRAAPARTSLSTAQPDISVELAHYIGGPCGQGRATAVCAVQQLSASEVTELGGTVGGTMGGIWAVANLRRVARIARLDAHRSGLATALVRVHWGDARWSRTQLLGEIARGSWGMCRTHMGDLFGHDQAYEQTQWSALQGSGRLIHAPRSEMTDHFDSDDDTQPQNTQNTSTGESMDDQMARHRAELRRRALQADTHTLLVHRQHHQQHQQQQQQSPQSP